MQCSDLPPPHEQEWLLPSEILNTFPCSSFSAKDVGPLSCTKKNVDARADWTNSKKMTVALDR